MTEDMKTKPPQHAIIVYGLRYVERGTGRVYNKRGNIPIVLQESEITTSCSLLGLLQKTIIETVCGKNWMELYKSMEPVVENVIWL